MERGASAKVAAGASRLSDRPVPCTAERLPGWALGGGARELAEPQPADRAADHCRRVLRWQDIASDPPCATRRTVFSSPGTRSTKGQIYVFGSGADFGASACSVERLAALAPAPRKLLTAHDVAVSDRISSRPCATRCARSRRAPPLARATVPSSRRRSTASRSGWPRVRGRPANAIVRYGGGAAPEPNGITWDAANRRWPVSSRP